MFGFTYYGINEDGNCEEVVFIETTKEKMFALLEEIKDEAAHENPPYEIDPVFFVTYSRQEIEKYF